MPQVAQQENPSTHRQRVLVVLGTVVISYVLAFLEVSAEPVFPYSNLELIAVAVIGLIYSVLLVREDLILGGKHTSGRHAVYFIIMLALLTATYSLTGVINGLWLLAMPLLGTGAAILPRLWGWIFAGGILLSMIIPTAFRFGISEMLSLSVNLLPAFLFVIVFVRLWINAEEAREKTQTLADELEAANRQLSAYATQAEELATTKERNRLAREIHDSLGHYLTVINVQIEAARTIMSQNPEQANDSLKKAQMLTQEGLASVRQSVATLRESPLQDRPLTTAIVDLVEESRNAGLVTELEILGDGRTLEPNAELTLYRAVQEGLTNVRKHARASRVDLTLDYRDAERVSLTIQDNGVGAQSASGGFGLLGVGERVKLLAGEMVLDTSPGNGFQLRIMVPA